MPLGGRPMVEWSIAAFRAVEAVRSIVVACPSGHDHELGGDQPDEPSVGAADVARSPLRVVDGGRTRSESVSNALAVVETELVAIHDAARPLVTPELIEGVVTALEADPSADGAIAATPVTDTIKRATSPTSTTPERGQSRVREILETVDRGRLWAAQTPQVFRSEALREAFAAAERPEEATDEAMLVEAAGGRVLIHPSSPENLKVTTPFDLRVAALLLSGRG